MEASYETFCAVPIHHYKLSWVTTTSICPVGWYNVVDMDWCPGGLATKYSMEIITLWNTFVLASSLTYVINLMFLRKPAGAPQLSVGVYVWQRGHTNGAASAAIDSPIII